MTGTSNSFPGMPFYCLRVTFLCFPFSMAAAVFLALILSFSAVSAVTNITTDEHALLSLKASITTNWSSSATHVCNWTGATHVCNWTGVICNRHRRVAALSLSNMGLLGTLPPSMGNLSFLVSLTLRNNSFSGDIPKEMAQLRRIKVINLNFNNFSGGLPTGIIPNSLGDLGLLEILGLGDNNFTSEPSSSELSFITSMTNCKRLTMLDIGNNLITGTLPVSIGNLSASLYGLYANGCRIRGTIPNEIGNLSNLVTLRLNGNDLSGSIPNTIKGLQQLQRIYVGYNKLRGSIPNDLCQLPNLSGFYSEANQLSGSLPACLWNISSFRYLDLSSNKLISRIPPSFGNLKDLLTFNASFNSLHGNLPSEIENLKVVTLLDLSYNNFSGDIPGSIGNLQNLVTLSLENNDLIGTIPETFGSLVSLEILNLSQNNLSGIIPKSLDKLLHLEYFNVSYNKLHGEIPSGGQFGNFTRKSFLPNGALCGATQFGVRPCKTNSTDRLKTLQNVVIISVSSAISLVVLVLMSVLLWIRCQKSKRLPVEINLQPVAEHRRITYQEIREATNGFEEENLLGNGSFGSVYKGILSDGMVLAIKVFKLQKEKALKSFHIECDIIRTIRHRNLIKIVTSCSTPDFKALILEYMPNGSLEKWLYSHSYVLNIPQRLDIMIDLSYVEYGLEGSVSTSCDVYSYGIVLLETFTRKKPTDEMFAGQMTLKCWVKESLPSAVIRVLDKNLLMQESENSLAEQRINMQESENSSAEVDCVSSILTLALDCAAESPEQRINVKDAMATLKKIRALHFANMGLVGSIPPSIRNLYALFSSILTTTVSMAIYRMSWIVSSD
ncbi:hypothetical protein RJ640_029415 [Escallonia rubra]|uniref:Protein kinase domain-containing protein n=1 Tax=Escallonia rubra TaxID=112253 RepID=A0AA88QP23_9ASTE|nr:hypothetical protein RJ640_029415 [Escallonia rubra]